MVNDYQATLAAWWTNADQEPVRKGDTVIKRHPDGRYTIREAEKGWENTNYRVLSRAKPAWHDAVAVIAHTARFAERRPFALTHTRDILDPYNTEWITTDDLIDPVPLIEARVTDDMIKRYRDKEVEWNFEDPSSPSVARLLLTAALGIGDDK